MTAAAHSARGAAVLLLAFSTSAHAHSTFAGVGDFYAGILHPLTALEHVLPFLAFGLLAGRYAVRSRPVLPLFAAALMLGAGVSLVVPAVPAVDLVNIVSALLFGGLIAAGSRLTSFGYAALAIVFGSTHGYANGLAIVAPIAWYAFIPGIGLAGLAVAAYGFVVADWVQQRQPGWMHTAVRVAGSWIAAIGMLVLATTWRQLAG